MAYTVNLFYNSSNPNRMNKALTSAGNASCDFKAPIDVENPTIYIRASADLDGVNYIEIPEFNRYYFAKCIGGTSQTLTFECTSDPLMSFKSAILSSPAVIARNPWRYDKYLPDSKMPIESRTVRETYKFYQSASDSPFSGSNNCFVLTTVGPGNMENS